MKTMMEGGTPEEEIAYWKAIVVSLKDELRHADLEKCIVGLQQQLHQAHTKHHDEANAHFITMTELTSEIEKLEAENKKLRAHLSALLILDKI